MKKHRVLFVGAALLAGSWVCWAGPQDGPKLDAAALDAMVLCTDGKSHYVALAPHEISQSELFYGDGKSFVEVGWRPPPRSLTGRNFLDPRMFNKTANPDFRGVDVRLYSEVEYDAEKRTCAVRCGETTTQLSVVPADKAKAMVHAAKFGPSPQKHLPYALARDDRGTYYYVDHGATQQTERSFRLFRGPSGNMQLQKMTNVVSDSEGDVFSTSTGSLRLILGRNESSWVETEKPRKLVLVPWEKNLRVIYTELGVYTGQRLGTPCDDL